VLFCHPNRLWVRVRVTPEISGVGLGSVKSAPVVVPSARLGQMERPYYMKHDIVTGKNLYAHV
jgi:hypothetical protein